MPAPVVIICNPRAGRRRRDGQLRRRLERRFGSTAEIWETETPWHASELATRAAAEGASVVGAAGGDGLAHEVANGLLDAAGADLGNGAAGPTLAVIPVGSANDYAHSIARQFGRSRLEDASGALVDVGSATLPDGRRRWFVEGLGLGLAGRVTLESQRIERLRGVWLYGLAAWRALRNSQAQPLEIEHDGEPSRTASTLMLSLLLGRREGAFPLAPGALLNDGWFDLVHAGRLSRWQAVRLLPRLALKGPPQAHPEIWLGRCQSLRARSSAPLVIHTDGEMLAVEEDGHCGVDVRLVPGALRVKVC